ncbi:MAG: hypothetical protein WD960_04975 [Gemmatimonadota bacterium]
MDSDDFGSWFRRQPVGCVGRGSGTIVAPTARPPTLHGEPVPLVLPITMRDGNEYRLTLDVAVGEARG